jgi:hypothetical protein
VGWTSVRLSEKTKSGWERMKGGVLRDVRSFRGVSASDHSAVTIGGRSPFGAGNNPRPITRTVVCASHFMQPAIHPVGSSDFPFPNPHSFIQSLTAPPKKK